MAFSSSSSSTSKHISKLMDLLHLQSILENKVIPNNAAKGFSTRGLDLHFDNISAKQFHFSKEQQSLTFRYKIPNSTTTTLFQPPPQQQHDVGKTGGLTLGPLLALIDDVTSWSALLGDPWDRKQFGVSIQLQAEWALAQAPPPPPIVVPPLLLQPGQDLIVTTRNTKIGRQVAFIDAHVYDATSDQLIAFGSHTKFLDMGWIINLALSKHGFPLLQKGILQHHSSSTILTKFVEYFLPLQSSDSSMSSDDALSLFDSLELSTAANDDDDDDNDSPPATTTTTASVVGTFSPQSRHGSLGGPLHGGCQACLMELIGRHCAQEHVVTTKLLQPNTTTTNDERQLLRLESMQIDYLSSPQPSTKDGNNNNNNRNAMDLEAKVLHETSNPERKSIWLQTKILSPKKGRVASQGKLRFSIL